MDLVKNFFNEDGSLKASATKVQMESGFMWACEYGQTSVVEFLLDNRVDVDTRVHGMTGLHWAVIGGHLNTIKLLLERKAPLEVKNNYGGTALGQATWAIVHSDPVYRWPNPETNWVTIIKTLIDAGANVNAYPGLKERIDQLFRHD